MQNIYNDIFNKWWKRIKIFVTSKYRNINIKELTVYIKIILLLLQHTYIFTNKFKERQ